MGRFIDLTGRKFGRLTVIARAENKGEIVFWLCECECGKVRVVQGCSLRSGRTKSCGCLQKEKVAKMHETHGQACGNHTRIYKIYHKIKGRCTKENDSCYKEYGGAGITLCDEWLNDFRTFYEWAMANGYADNLTIDRIDGTKGYSPDNCRWATYKVQNNNTSRNHLITYNGKSQTMAQWAEEMGINYGTLSARLNRSKWSIERALTTK